MRVPVASGVSWKTRHHMQWPPSPLPGVTDCVNFEVVIVDGGPHVGPDRREVGENGHEFGRAERGSHVQTDGRHGVPFE